MTKRFLLLLLLAVPGVQAQDVSQLINHKKHKIKEAVDEANYAHKDYIQFLKNIQKYEQQIKDKVRGLKSEVSKQKKSNSSAKTTYNKAWKKLNTAKQNYNSAKNKINYFNSAIEILNKHIKKHPDKDYQESLDDLYKELADQKSKVTSTKAIYDSEVKNHAKAKKNYDENQSSEGLEEKIALAARLEKLLGHEKNIAMLEEIPNEVENIHFCADESELLQRFKVKLDELIKAEDKWITPKHNFMFNKTCSKDITDYKSFMMKLTGEKKLGLTKEKTFMKFKKFYYYLQENEVTDFKQARKLSKDVNSILNYSTHEANAKNNLKEVQARQEERTKIGKFLNANRYYPQWAIDDVKNDLDSAFYWLRLPVYGAQKSKEKFSSMSSVLEGGFFEEFVSSIDDSFVDNLTNLDKSIKDDYNHIKSYQNRPAIGNKVDSSYCGEINKSINKMEISIKRFNAEKDIMLSANAYCKEKTDHLESLYIAVNNSGRRSMVKAFQREVSYDVWSRKDLEEWKKKKGYEQ